jgi:hypothetical protein
MDLEKELKGQACHQHADSKNDCSDVADEKASSNDDNIPKRTSDGPAIPYGLPGKDEEPGDTPPVSSFA